MMNTVKKSHSTTLMATLKLQGYKPSTKSKYLIKILLEMISTTDFLLIFRCSKNIEGQLFDVTNGSPCRTDPRTSLPATGCKFFPNKYQNTHSSIMFQPSMDSVSIDFTFSTNAKFNLDNSQSVICKI